MNVPLPTGWEATAVIVGWSLLHFLWQGAVVACVTALLLRLVGQRRAELRYVVCGAGLATLFVGFLVTVGLVAGRGAGPAPGSAVAFAGLQQLVTGSWQVVLRDALPWVTLAWVGGLGVMQVRLVLQLMAARSLRREGLGRLPPRWRAAVAEISAAIGMRRPVEAFLSARATVPMVVGWLKPVVLVPASALTGLSSEQLRAVLAHELAHIRRHDALVNLGQIVCESLFFFHPAVWWLSDRMRIERECCCDDVAVETCGDALTFARALSDLDALRVSSAPTLAATGGSLMLRISRLLGVRDERERFVGAWMAPALAALVLTVGVSALGFSGNDDEQERRRPLDLSDVDVVKVVGEHDAATAELLAQMRAAGIADDLLFAVLVGVSDNPAPVHAVYHAAELAAERRQFHAELRQLHEEVKAGIKNGSMTEAQGKQRLADLKHHRAHSMDGEDDLLHLRRKPAPGGERHGIEKARHGIDDGPLLAKAMHKKVEELEQHMSKVRLAVEAQHLDEATAAIKLAELGSNLEVLREQLAAVEAGRHPAGDGLLVEDERVFLKTRKAFDLEAARLKLNAARESGRLSAEDTQRALEKLHFHELHRRELHERKLQHEGRQHDESLKQRELKRLKQAHRETSGSAR